MARLSKAESERKRNQAYELYMNTNSTLAEIAEAIEVGPDTVGEWATKNQWRQAKAANSITREKNVSMMLVQMNNLLEAINARPVEQRFPSSAESDTINKMTKTIRDLSGRTSLPDFFNVQTEFIKYLHAIKPALAKELVGYSKEFLQAKAKELDK